MTVSILEVRSAVKEGFGIEFQEVSPRLYRDEYGAIRILLGGSYEAVMTMVLD